MFQALSFECTVENAGPMHLLCFGDYDFKVLRGRSKGGVAWAQKGSLGQDMTWSQGEWLFSSG